MYCMNYDGNDIIYLYIYYIICIYYMYILYIILFFLIFLWYTNRQSINQSNQQHKKTIKTIKTMTENMTETYVDDLEMLFELRKQTGAEEVKRGLLDTLQTSRLDKTEKGEKPHSPSVVHTLFSLPVIKRFLQPRSSSLMEVKEAMEFLRSICPFQEPTQNSSSSPSIENIGKMGKKEEEEEEKDIKNFMRTFHTKEGKAIVPHALSHKTALKEKTPEAWTKGCAVWKVLSTLTFESFDRDGEKNKQTVRDLLSTHLPFPHEVVDINVQINAPYVRIGDINVGVVIKALETPVRMEMASGIAEKEIMLMTRHGGTTLYPFVDKNKLEKLENMQTTSSLVVTGWISGDGTADFQAGTMYTGNHLPGRGPKDIYGAFWKSYPDTDTTSRQKDLNEFLEHTGPYQALIVDM